jgi:hypothetical protein
MVPNGLGEGGEDIACVDGSIDHRSRLVLVGRCFAIAALGWLVCSFLGV